MSNKYENIEVIDLCDITEMPDLIIDVFYETGSSMCFISDRESVEYTMIELFKHDDITADEIFLFESMFPMFVGIDNHGRVTVDDIEEEWYLNYETVFVDLESVLTQDIIDKCLDKDINVILIGRVEDCEECDLPCDNKEALSTEDPIHGFNVSFSNDDMSYEFKFYSSSVIDKDDIMSILKDIKL